MTYKFQLCCLNGISIPPHKLRQTWNGVIGLITEFVLFFKPESFSQLAVVFTLIEYFITWIIALGLSSTPL